MAEPRRRGLARVLPAPAIGVLTFTVMFVALLVWSIPFFLPVAVLKVLLPIPTIRRRLTRALVWIAQVPWVGTNQWIFRLLHGRRRGVDIIAEQGLELDLRQSWLIISNHQSWADILLLLDVFFGRAPFPRFFLKRELIWVPLIGFICWAMDMPFMTRQRGASGSRDLETTRRFCQQYRGEAISVVNFAEGTRFTPAKNAQRGGGFTHLLRPKSAGLSFTLNAMGDQFAGLVDVTVDYQPSRRSKLWSFLCGEQSAASVEVHVSRLPADMLDGDYASDTEFRERFQIWVNALWSQKDARLQQRRDSAAANR